MLSGHPNSLPGPRALRAVRSLLKPLLPILLAAFATAPHAEQAASSLQIAPELTIPGSAAASKPSQDILLVPEAKSQEIRDELPPLPTIDLTTPPDDLWQRIRNGFGMPDLNSPLVAERQAWYLNRPEMLQRIFERSRRYLHHIVEELEKRGMPTELALLPIVESAFNPTAYSPARALGMWQFIPSTGKNYNLKQNWWLDERRDIIASTAAALDYLQNIYEMHGDWHLALASYNWGEHAVARAIAKNQAKGLPTDYQSLTMPGETRYYVPKLQAIKNIVAQPELFGFRLDPIPNKAYFGTVDLNETVDIATAAKLAETSIDEFIALNPAYHRPVIPGESKSPIVIPADKMDTFLSNLARYEAQDRPLSSWRTYQLKKGEKIETVAARFGITVARLKQMNGITPRMKIGPGQNFLVPSGSTANADAVAAYLPKTPAERPAKAVRSAKGKHKAGHSAPATRRTAAPAKSGMTKKPSAQGSSGKTAPTQKKKKGR